MPISQLPPAPARTDDPATFISKTDAFLPALTTFVNETNTLAAALNSIAAGGAYAIPYVFDSNTATSDPGNGKFRFGSATQSSSTSICLDNVSSVGADVSGLLASTLSSSSNVKGKLRLMKQTDATKWITFDVMSGTTPVGFVYLTIANAWGSSPSPFVTGDAVLMFFERTGDVGSPGSLFRRVSYLANNAASVTPDLTVTDAPTVNGLVNNLTFNAPVTSSSFSDCQQITFRIRDNGTPRTLAWNTAYRAGTDLTLPTSTSAGKMLYVGFMYNAIDLKWDLIAVTGNI